MFFSIYIKFKPQRQSQTFAAEAVNLLDKSSQKPFNFERERHISHQI